VAPEWSADVAVDAPLVRRLIHGQFPQLALETLELVAEGWDNTVWLVDGEWAFRVPRREIAIAGVEREVAVLPTLAPLLPLPIPAPVFAGRPAEGYPWPFFGARYLPGRELAEAGDGADRDRLARPLARFLRALHDPAVLAAVDPARELPVDFNHRGDMEFRVPRTLERVAELEALGGLWRLPPELRDTLQSARGLAESEAETLAHGDLNVRHLLVDGDGVLAAVIDWGDLCRADPAIDLMLVWSLLSPEARDAFLQEYGPVSDAQLLRARVLAVFLDASLAVYARDRQMTGLEREALAGLARTAVSWSRPSP
jgi:aminoglycoside phosphotransferase (APT) family kinase protein